MRFEETPIAGCFMVRIDPHADERGFFARTVCADDFGARKLVGRFSQCSISFNHHRGTVRGMHFQRAPHSETKLVRCTRGAIFDAAIDLRPNSPSFRAVAGVELTADNRAALYVPAGVAHGFQTLSDDAEVLYMIDPAFAPGFGDGVRWDDPAFGLRWPEPVTLIADRDASWPLWQDRG